MGEIRKKLTDVQAKYLTETQEALNKARTALSEAEADAQRTLTLIFDAVGLSADAMVRFDEETKELIHFEPDKAEAKSDTKATAP